MSEELEHLKCIHFNCFDEGCVRCSSQDNICDCACCLGNRPYYTAEETHYDVEEDV